MSAGASAEITLRGQDGGGGGVIRRDGMYLTFGSAKVQVGPPQGLTQIPNLDLLISVLEVNQNGIPDSDMATLMQAVLPSPTRRYFKVEPNQLNSETYKRLIEEYAKLLKNQVDPNNLSLAAITIQEDTFLLPPFFSLKSAEQAAILFHESLWLVKPDIKYDELVSAEIVMQAHIERNGVQPAYNSELVAILSGLVNKPQYALYAAIKEDIQAGVFEKYQLPLGVPYMAAGYSKKKPLHYSKQHYSLKDLFPKGVYKNQKELFMDVTRAIKKYPEFKFLKVMYDNGSRLTSTDSYLDMALVGIPQDGNIQLSSSCVIDKKEFRKRNFSDVAYGVMDLFAGESPSGHYTVHSVPVLNVCIE